MTAEIEVLESKEAVARRAADLLVSARGHVGLSGGSTPKAAYSLAGQERTDWTGVTLWLGDERYVPIDDERSNAGMVRASLGLVPELVRTDTSWRRARAVPEKPPSWRTRPLGFQPRRELSHPSVMSAGTVDPGPYCTVTPLISLSRRRAGTGSK